MHEFGHPTPPIIKIFGDYVGNSVLKEEILLFVGSN
jgi:hypothetical protein